MFPLEVVLFPRTFLPLHIFEPRYKEMIGDCLRESTKFGVVLAQGNGVLHTGCAASIEKVVHIYEDGRMDILTKGRLRFEIQALHNDRSYFQADVSYFDDDDAAPADPGVIRDATELHSELASILNSDREMPDLNDPLLSFQLAQISPDLHFRQILLQMRSESERMDRVLEHLRSLIERQKAKNFLHRVSRTNGHGKPPRDLN